MAGQASDRFARAVRFSRIASVFAFLSYSSETNTASGLVTKTTREPLVSEPSLGQWLLLLPFAVALVLSVFFAENAFYRHRAAIA